MIAVLGATGRSGKWLVKELLDAGFNVRVLVRNPDAVAHLKDRVEIVSGDAADYQCVEATMRGNC